MARLAVKAGHEVMLSNSRDPRTLTSTMISVGCTVGTARHAAMFGDLVLVAIPFFAIKDLDAASLDGRIVLDANNYYPARDGVVPELDAHETTTSEMLAAHLAGARVVKAFNAILERDIESDARPAGAPDRRALPIAGDDAEAKQAASGLLESLGYDAVDAGPLKEGWRFERARPAYCVPLDRKALEAALKDADSQVAEGSWRARA